jgi:uncharacterized protein (DUF488 family)
MDCDALRTVHTIGHSTRTLEEFMMLLRAHAIETLVDVRRWPASRRYPHFNRTALSESLKSGGTDYLWRGDLGGFRKPAADSVNSAWRVGAFRAYADFMLTAEFERIMSGMESLAADRRIALMCAEAVPWRCHRQLIADALVARGAEVLHMLGPRRHEAHALHKDASVAPDGAVTYPPRGQRGLFGGEPDH